MIEVEIDRLRARLDAHERRLTSLRSSLAPARRTQLDQDLATLRARRRALTMCQGFLSDPAPNSTWSTSPEPGLASVNRLAEWFLQAFSDAYPEPPAPELN